MDVYDEVDRRETDAGKDFCALVSMLSAQIRTVHSLLLCYLQCGWPHRITAPW